MVSYSDVYHNSIAGCKGSKMNVLSFEEQAQISHRMAIEAKADVWRAKARSLKVAEEEEKLAREDLIAVCEGDFEGCGVKVEQIERKGSVEYKAIPELSDVNLEHYRKPPTVYWMVKSSVKE